MDRVKLQEEAMSAPAVECVTTLERLSELAPAWDRLAARDPGAHVFQGAPWIASWLRHHPGARPLLVVARRGEQMTAALPLCLHATGRGPASVRTLRFLGDGNADYCGALADPEHPDDVHALWAALLRRRDWHLAELRFLPADSPLARLLTRAHGARDTSPKAPTQARRGLRQSAVRKLRSAIYLVDRRQQDVAPYLDITVDWQETVPKSQRPKLLRKRRQLQELGEVRFEVASTPEQVDETIEQLAAMHAARWGGRGETSLFLIAESRTWVRGMCRDLLASGQLYLCRLSVGDRPAAIGLYFLAGRCLLNTIYSFDEEFKKFGPVHQLVLHAVEDARARDLADVHHFGRGGEEYKYRWTDQQHSLERFIVARPSLFGLAAYGWVAHLKPFLWKHHRLATSLREARKRLRLKGQAPDRGSTTEDPGE